MIVEAMKEFSQAFRSARVENELKPEQLADMKDSLGTYYQSDFSWQYMDKNNGEPPAEPPLKFRNAEKPGIAAEIVYTVG